MADKYTTLANVVQLMGERHAINCAVERSGALITDADVIASINDMIEFLSRELDGYLRGHTTVPIPEADVPDGIEVLVRGYTGYRLWARRGRFDENNPHYDEKVLYFERVKNIQTGKWKFETASGEVIAQKPVEYETDRILDDIERKDSGRKFTDTLLRDFTNP